MASNGNGNGYGGGGRMQDVNVQLILTIGVISCLLLVVTIVGIQAWYHFEAYEERQRKVYAVPNRELVELKQSQRDRLGNIDQAMQTYIDQQQARRGADTLN